MNDKAVYRKAPATPGLLNIIHGRIAVVFLGCIIKLIFLFFGFTLILSSFPGQRQACEWQHQRPLDNWANEQDKHLNKERINYNFF